ncbi:MAG: CbiQ family ECF transporter T component [Bryobacteraceae bacterium]
MHRHVPLDHIAYSNRWSGRHPMEKGVLGGGLLLVAVMAPPMPTALMVAAVTTALATIHAKIPARTWFRLLGAQSIFLISAMLVIGWQSGWAQAGALVLRSLAATSCLLLVALTTPLPSLFMYASRWTSTRQLAELGALVYRFLAVIIETIAVTRAAVRQRFGAVRGWREWAALGQVSGRVLTRTLDRAMRLERGFQSRGIEGAIPVYDAGVPISGRFVAWSVALQAVILLLGGFLR